MVCCCWVHLTIAGLINEVFLYLFCKKFTICTLYFVISVDSAQTHGIKLKKV